MKQHQPKIIGGLLIFALLVIAFFFGEPQKPEEAPPSPAAATILEQENKNATEISSVPPLAPSVSSKPEKADPTPSSSMAHSPSQENEQKTIVEHTKEEASKQAPDQATSIPEPTQDAPKRTVTLSIRCDAAVKSDVLPPALRKILPKDGTIFPEQAVEYFEQETVFHVLLRELKKAGIHFEFENTPMYETVYVEGIANLYEFDLGDLSGWMYRVNGVYPNYGCSHYKINPGDRIEWIYTCDMGNDIGGYNDLSGE